MSKQVTKEQKRETLPERRSGCQQRKGNTKPEKHPLSMDSESSYQSFKKDANQRFFQTQNAI